MQDGLDSQYEVLEEGMRGVFTEYGVGGAVARCLAERILSDPRLMELNPDQERAREVIYDNIELYLKEEEYFDCSLNSLENDMKDTVDRVLEEGV